MKGAKDQRPYLYDLLARIQMIRDFTTQGRADFIQSLKTQESVLRCFEVIGEIVKRLPPNLIAGYSLVPWRQLAGFRDILIHQYDKIDVAIVWKAVAEDLDPMQSAVEAMLRSLNAEQADQPDDTTT